MDFLKSLQAEQLPAADELEGLIIRSLSPLGIQAATVAQHLIRLVARSKHAGPSARSAYDHDTLLNALREEGISDESLIGAGLLTSGRVHRESFWETYRTEVVKSFRTFRVYGLNVERAVFADLPSLFVPLKFDPISDRKKAGEREASKQRERRSLTESIFAESRDRQPDELTEKASTFELSAILREKRRFGLIGGPGSGKTTTLKWLALVSAMGGEEGKEARSKYGLPIAPLLPLFVRFRRLADRIQARGLDGIAGRVGLVAEFLAAELEAGLAGKLPNKREALEMAEELLSSENSIFLFDALDEVPDPEVRARLFDAVADLMQRYPNPRVVVSSRPYAFREERAPIDLALFEPLPLNRDGRRVFAQQWYRAVRSHLGDGLTESDAESRAEDLAKSAEILVDLAENPLLLSILALVHFNRQGLPVERSALYDQATLAMLGHWERDPAGRDLGNGVIPPEWGPTLRLPDALVRRIVECLARDVQRRDQDGGEFSKDIALEALSHGLEVAASMPRSQAGERAPSLLRLLVERSGIVQERSPDVFAFAHLSFQDYLAARWFVGTGEQGLSELATISSEPRHAEVIRFAVAIFASDQRAEADERALRLVHEVGTRDAVLAAACLLDAPRLQLSENAVEQLARRVWGECASMWRREHHPMVASRLVWTLLERSSHADDLLLEFLTVGSSGQRRPMEGEMEVYLLVSRPPIPISARFGWVLRQLERSGERDSWRPLWSIAALLLIEGHATKPEQHLAALVRLLGEEHWRDTGRGTLGERAGRILHVLACADTRQVVGQALEKAINCTDEKGNSDRIAYGAAKFLVSLGMEVRIDPSEVLIQRGLEASYRHSEVSRDIRTLLNDDRHQESILAALHRGLTSDSDDVRKGSARTLRDAGVTSPITVLLEGDEQETARSEDLRSLVTDPSQKASTIAALTEALWDEREEIAWRAVQV
ncbi:MAG: NACHT domain-containing protein, partial [Terracidiphilus sp.]